MGNQLRSCRGGKRWIWADGIRSYFLNDIVAEAEEEGTRVGERILSGIKPAGVEVRKTDAMML